MHSSKTGCKEGKVSTTFCLFFNRPFESSLKSYSMVQRVAQNLLIQLFPSRFFYFINFSIEILSRARREAVFCDYFSIAICSFSAIFYYLPLPCFKIERGAFPFLKLGHTIKIIFSAKHWQWSSRVFWRSIFWLRGLAIMCQIALTC